MKKMSFYMRTWFVSVSILVLTLVIGFSIFIGFTGFFLKQHQERQFVDVKRQIQQKISQDDIDQKYFEELLLRGYFITILLDGKAVYPTNQPVIISSNGQLPENFDGETVIQTFEVMRDSDYLSEDFTAEYQETDYTVNLIRNVSISSEDYQSVVSTTVPIFLIIGLVVSGAASILYAQYFTRKIQHVNQTIDQMSHSDYQPTIVESKDEMQILENNVSRLYLELKKNLEQLQKDYLYIESLEKERNLFMKGATHELKTPIMAMQTVIEGYFAELPDSDYSNPENVLRKCQGQLRSMTKLVNELLALANVELSQETTAVDVRETLETVIQWSQILLDEKQQEVKLDLPKISMTISQKMLLKVFSNIISNAIHHGKSKSIIEIELSGDGQELIVRNQTNQAIEDSEKLFQPFYTTQEEEYEGHGLGLYLVKNSLSNYGYETFIRLPDKETFELVILLQK